MSYLFGTSPKEDKLIKEIKCIVLVPQISTYSTFIVSKYFPENVYLNDFEPWELFIQMQIMKLMIFLILTLNSLEN